MARRYSRSAGNKVKRVMEERKQGTLRSGSGKKVTSRKQAIAIGLSEARRAGERVPAKNSSGGSAGRGPGRRKSAAGGRPGSRSRSRTRSTHRS